MASFIQADQYTYVNQDQIQIIRRATESEMDGKERPVTTIVMQNDVRYYVHDYPSEVAKKVKIEEIRIEEDVKCEKR